MPDTHDYPLAEVFGSGDLIHQARPAALFGSRIETRCGMEGNRTGRDGGAWCPECVALAQAAVDVDDKSGPFRNDLRTQLVTAGTEAAEQWLAVRANRKMSDVNRRRLAGHVVNALWTEIEHAVLEMAPYFGDEQRSAESATVLPERWRALIAERDAANERAEKAERASRLLIVGQNELDRQWAETDAATRAEFEEWMNEQRERTEKAERQRDVVIALGNRRKWQRDEARAQMYRIIGAIEHAYALNTYVELEPGEQAPTIEALWAEVRQIRGVAADALVGTGGGSSPRTLPSGPATEYRYVLADGRESELELHNGGPCGCRREQRPVYVGDWRPAPDVTPTKQPTSLEKP